MRTHILSEVSIGSINITELNNEALVKTAHEMQQKFQDNDATYFFNRRRYNCFIEYKNDENIRALGRIAVQQIRNYFTKLYSDPTPYEVQLQGWSMVQGWGEFVMPHHHNGHHLSAVYYADVPEVVSSPIKNSGAIFFHNPNAIARSWIVRSPNAETIHKSFVVKTGDFVIFPSHIMHYVSPWFGERERVCYAMNFFLKREQDWEEMLSEVDLW